jgi:DNA replication protein DnaC
VDEDARVARPCACRPQQVERRRAHSLSAVIPRKYRNVSFDQPPVTEIAEPVVRAVRRYVADIDGAPGGRRRPVARGRRRHRARRPWRCSSRGRAGRRPVRRDLLRAAACSPTSARRSTRTATGSYVDFIDRLARVDLLHLDDLGAERSSSWVLEQLYAIVNARYEDERSILITTNLRSTSSASRSRRGRSRA